MRPIIKQFTLNDDSPLSENFDCFSINVSVEIGPSDADSAELYSFQIVTPKYLAKQIEREDVIFGRHLLIVNSYNEEQIKNRIQKFLDTLIGYKSWSDVSEKISRHGHWEFEGYKS
jgi:hypothetical protein